MLFDSALPRASATATLNEPSVALRTLPLNLAEQDRYLFAPAFRHEVATSQLLQLENITALASGWLYQGLTLLKDSFVDVRQPGGTRRAKTLAKRILLGLSADKIGEGTWITDTWSRNYFHWLTDAICRLYLAKQKDVGLRLLLPSSYKAVGYTEESLRPFDLASTVFIPENRALFINRLAFPTYAAETGNYNEDVIRSVGALYRNYYGVAQPQGRRVYISRSKAPVRKVLNEDEVLPVLSRYGFELVHCENMSFSQQVKLLSECSMLAGPHGAGFVNMMFMPPGGRVLEIHPRDTKINNCYFSLASAFAHPYYYMLANTASTNLPSHLDNMIVDTRELEKNLEAMSRGR